MALLAKSTAYTRVVLIVQTADHLTGLTGASPTVTLSKAGGTFAALGGSVAEVTGGTGHYKISLNTTDTNTLGDLAIHVTATNGDATDIIDQVTTRLLDDLAYPATSGRSMVVDANGLVDANAVKLGPSGTGTAQTARDLGTSVLLSSGSGTGQLDFTSGVVKANLAQILGTALTETAGQIAAAFKQFFDVASPTGTMKAITNVVTTTTATNLTNAPTAGDFTATMKTSLNSATPAVTVSDKTGFSLSSAGIQAIWDALTSVLTTVGSIGKLLVTNIDAAISSRSTYAGGDTAGTTTLLSRIGTPTGASISADLAEIAAETDLIAVLPTAASVKAQVVSALASDTYAKPGVGTPSANPSLMAAIMQIYTDDVNKHDANTTTEKTYADDGTTVIQQAPVAYNAGTTTTTRGATVSG